MNWRLPDICVKTTTDRAEGSRSYYTVGEFQSIRSDNGEVPIKIRLVFKILRIAR